MWWESLPRGTPPELKAQEWFGQVDECKLLGSARAHSRHLLVLFGFPTAAVTNYHKPSDLTTDLYSLRCILKVIHLKWGLSRWAKLMVSEGLCSFGKLEARIHHPASSTCIPWPVVPSSVFKVHHSDLCFHRHISFLWLWPCLLPLITSLWLHRTHLHNAGYSSCLEILNLIISAKSVLPYRVAYSQVSGSRVQTSWRGVCSIPFTTSKKFNI